jgi:tRNA(fMet)-specific endonuclease VapC
MSTVLLDTSVVSLLHPKKKDNSIRALYEPHMQDAVLALSFQCVAELWQWAEDQNWGEKNREGMDAFIRRFLVFPYDYELSKVWARVSAQCKKEGRRLEAGDAWIIATSVHRQIPLLTHDGDMVGLKISDLNVISYVNQKT